MFLYREFRRSHPGYEICLFRTISSKLNWYTSKSTFNSVKVDRKLRRILKFTIKRSQHCTPLHLTAIFAKDSNSRKFLYKTRKNTKGKTELVNVRILECLKPMSETKKSSEILEALSATCKPPSFRVSCLRTVSFRMEEGQLVLLEAVLKEEYSSWRFPFDESSVYAYTFHANIKLQHVQFKLLAICRTKYHHEE